MRFIALAGWVAVLSTHVARAQAPAPGAPPGTPTPATPGTPTSATPAAATPSTPGALAPAYGQPPANGQPPAYGQAPAYGQQPGYGTQQPMMVGRPLSEHTVDRHGLVLLGGFTTDGDNGAPRVDMFMPMPMASAPQFRIGLSFSYDSDSASIPDLSMSIYGAGVELLGAYDWRLPIATYSGDFVVAVEGGPSVGRVWMKVDMFGMPGEWDSITGVGLGVASSLQYRAHNGFIASLQPLGIGIPIWHSEPASTNPFSINSDVSWEGALMVGYQWR